MKSDPLNALAASVSQFAVAYEVTAEAKLTFSNILGPAGEHFGILLPDVSLAEGYMSALATTGGASTNDLEAGVYLFAQARAGGKKMMDSIKDLAQVVLSRLGGGNQWCIWQRD